MARFGVGIFFGLRRRPIGDTLCVALSLVILTIGLSCPPPACGAETTRTNAVPQSSVTNGPVRLLEMRGRVVCLPEEMARAHDAELPTRHEHIWGFKTSDGACYTLLRARFSEAIWLDERLRTKELLVKARLFPGTQILELQSIKSVRSGVVHDLYYYCDVCAIQSVSPELCACCQGPVELVEKPLVGTQGD